MQFKLKLRVIHLERQRNTGIVLPAESRFGSRAPSTPPRWSRGWPASAGSYRMAEFFEFPADEHLEAVPQYLRKCSHF